MAWLLANKDNSTASNVTNGTSFSLKQESGNEYTLTIASNAATKASSNTGLFGMLEDFRDAGKTVSIKVTWVPAGDTAAQTSDVTWTNASALAGALGTDIGHLLGDLVESLTWTVTLDNTTYVIDVVEGPAV